jgi:hypothetical protein
MIHLAALVLATLPLVPHATPAEGWRAATARIVITPGEPLWLAGYGSRTHGAEGKLHELWVKVLALEAPGGRRGVVITSDVCGFSKTAVAAIRGGLQSRCGLEPSQVMITCSHTHSGPVLRECLIDYYPLDAAGLARVEQYSRDLERRVIDAVAQALTRLAPVTLWAGQSKATFAVNRRNNKEAQVPAMIARGEAFRGPVDHSVPVLAVRNSRQQLVAVLFGYACHTTTLSGYEWCGDYAGFAQCAIEAQHPQVQAMFHAGCGADQNPLPRRSVELCRKYGDQLAAAVEQTLAAPMRPLAARLRTAYATVDLDFQRHPTRDELQRASTKSGIRARWAARMLAMLDRGQSFPKSYPYPMLAWRLGDQLWFALGGEVVVDYALRLKATYGPTTWVTAYAQELVAYMPSRRVWDEGGYEGGYVYEYMLPADRWAPDLEQRILTGAARLVAALGRE